MSEWHNPYIIRQIVKALAQNGGPASEKHPFRFSHGGYKPDTPTEQKLGKLTNALFEKIVDRSDCIDKIDWNYTGTDVIGNGSYFNSPMCSYQLAFAMVLSNHPLVMQLLEKDVTPDNFDPEPLREAQILNGMKILDMGCGIEPTFARVSRCFGADAYTVDVIPASIFGVYIRHSKRFFTEESRKIEITKHIQLDLRDPNAAEKIAELSGGKFDLASDVHVRSGWNWAELGLGYCRIYQEDEELAIKLLKDGGFYFRPAAV